MQNHRFKPFILLQTLYERYDKVHFKWMCYFELSIHQFLNQMCCQGQPVRIACSKFLKQRMKPNEHTKMFVFIRVTESIKDI